MHLYMFYIVAKFRTPSYNTFGDMIFFLVKSVQTENDAYEPTVHKKLKIVSCYKERAWLHKLGSKTFTLNLLHLPLDQQWQHPRGHQYAEFFSGERKALMVHAIKINR